MRSRVLTFGTAAALALGPVSCVATEQPPEAVEPPNAEDDGRRRGVPAFRALDKDDDGVISASEIDTAAESLASLDDNGDGRLSGDELQPRRSRLMFGSPKNLPEGTRVITLNADGDDSIDMADLPPEVRSLLSSADADGDGTASPAQLLAAMMAAQGGEPRGEQENAEGGETPPPGTERDDERRVSLMATLDTDQDGTVSETEIESAAQSLRMLDSDGDGQLTAGELGLASGSDSGGDLPE